MTDQRSTSDAFVCFEDRFRDQRVLVTGHTGFKGTWLTQWLQLLGAKAFGLSLEPDVTPNHFSMLHQPSLVSKTCDVRDATSVHAFVAEIEPDIVFHLAAQSLVRKSYREPDNTFSTNIMGTLNVLQACRATPSVRAIVCVTSDKVYENLESDRGYVETDRLGGSDPYSCSKACAELLATCFRSSYLANASYGTDHHCLLATARAGNVIGGGDWCEDRLVPDAVRAAAVHRSMLVRNPNAVRPWQHVLEPLSGYLFLGQKLLEGDVAFADAWNFGPSEDADVSVGTVIQEMEHSWKSVSAEFASTSNGPHETKILKVHSSKSNQLLGWTPTWNWKQAVAKTASWYRDYYENQQVRTMDDLQSYLLDAKRLNANWIRS